MIEAGINEVRATGEVRLGDRKTELQRDESGYGCGLEWGTSACSQPINVEIAFEGQNGYRHCSKRHSYGECRTRTMPMP